jgi:hypothetical protein
LSHKRANGEKYSPLPYGFEEMEGRLVELPEEAAVIAEVVAMRNRGKTLVATNKECPTFYTEIG